MKVMKSSSAVLVLLHGSGDTGANLKHFLSMVPFLCDGEYLSLTAHLKNRGTDLICPTAASQPYAGAGGMYMNVWFNRSPNWPSLGLSDKEDIIGINTSMSELMRSIDGLTDTYDHIFLGGFSMGGGLILHTLRQYLPLKTRGIVTMGSFLVDSSKLLTEPLDGKSSELPVLMMHGRDDQTIPIKWGERTASNLLLCGVDVQFRSYPKLEHEIGEEELVDLLIWMDDVRHRLAEDNPVQPSTVTTPFSCSSTSSSTLNTQPIVTTILQNTNKITTTSSSQVEPREVRPVNGFAFILESGSANISIARFLVPSSLEEYLTSRPVLCCGGSFEIALHPHGGVAASFRSSQAEHTATEISKRLFNRWHGQSSEVNPCQTS